jgi:(4-(4-[2-(gamma-L-glutamylamino)ethyl]phenoxymethyl)furan-2-yl)methanamine synthase
LTARTSDRIALDVGGANVKLAHSAGVARSRSFPLWKHPERLTDLLCELTADLPRFGQVLLTTTAELCDCFETKREGVCAVVGAVTAAFPGHDVAVWGIDGRFHTPRTILDDPLLAAAANWLALATAVARACGEGAGLLVDVGSTTTDLIPFRDGRVTAEGRTDLQRLQTHELVYAGVRRTPVAALATSLPYRGRDTGLAAELFATTLDVYLTLGSIPDDEADCATADGRPATRAAAHDRLARVIGADRESVSPDDVLELARSADDALMTRLVRAARRVTRSIGGRLDHTIISGSGEFLARRVARTLTPRGVSIVSLAEQWGATASSVACARALLELASETERSP